MNKENIKIEKEAKNPIILFLNKISDNPEFGIAFDENFNKIFYSWIKQLNLEVEDFAIINVGKGNHRSLYSCLRNEINIFKPALIIAFGVESLNLILNSEKKEISLKEGELFETEFEKVMAFSSPFDVLKTPEYKISLEKISNYLKEKEIKIQYQEAENIAKVEMISAELAFIHKLCKESN